MWTSHHSFNQFSLVCSTPDLQAFAIIFFSQFPLNLNAFFFLFRTLVGFYSDNFLIQRLSTTQAKVSDWNLFRVNQNYSDSFRYLYTSQCESLRTNMNNVLYLVWWKKVKNQSDSIRLIPRHQSEWIRTNPKPSFQYRSIRINPSSDWSKPDFHSELIRIIPTLYSFVLILIENSVWINLSSDWFGLIWIENLVSD